MKALILAAGRGSRMQRYTNDRPKGLVELLGISLTERMVFSLKAAGINEIGLVTGYKKESYDFLNLPGFHNSEWANTNMVISLSCAEEWLKKSPILVCYSDIFVAPSTIQKLVQANHNLAITYDTQWLDLWQARNENVLDDAENFRIDTQGRITEIGNKANRVEDIQGQYMGLIKITPESWHNMKHLLDNMPAKQAQKMSMTEMLQLLIEDSYPLYGVPIAGEWGEVDTESDLLYYEDIAKIGTYGEWFYQVSDRKEES